MAFMSHSPISLRSPHPELFHREEDDGGAGKDGATEDTDSTNDEELGVEALAASSSEEESGEEPTTSGDSGDEQNTCCVSVPPDKALGQNGIFSRSQRGACVGFLAQYFAVGFIYSGVPSTAYGVFLGYLNVPAYVYATVTVISSLPWSFKFLFGMINDTMPICGLRRKPYMMIGWTFCAVALLILGLTPLPEPYWCRDEITGKYIKSVVLPDGTTDAAEPCNPDAAKAGGKYAFLLMLACLGYVIADVAADGLTTEYAKQEPIERRGKTQTTAYLTRTLGGVGSTVFVGLCMNGHEYNGSFTWTLSFETVALVMAIPAVLMVPLSAYLVKEPPRQGPAPSGGEYMAMCWELLKSKATFYIILYCFLSSAIGGISTPAGGYVKTYWAGVENLQNQIFSLVGLLLFAGGLYMVKKWFLNTSWRLLLGVTIVLLQVIDSVFSTLTIFDIVRNQYFYMGETVLVELPLAANFVVSTFVIVEMADNGNEGMVYGLLTTTANLGGPVARAIGNQLYTVFTPSLSDSRNYIKDTPEFRSTVFHSFLLSYAFPIFSLFAVFYFLPDQKEQTAERKKNWKKRPIYGVITLTLLSVAFVYSLTVNFLAMFPSTMCMKFAGGDGCEEEVSS